MIYITSDLHFGHDRDFLYEPRGFKNMWEHDEALIKNWNEVIQPEDEVYILGDIMLNDNEHGIKCLKSLKGNIHIIRGNHDSPVRIKLYEDCHNVVEVCEGKYLQYKKYHFYLSHYPCLCGNHDEDKPLKARVISLCGHTHTPNSFIDFDKGLIYHCEVDAHNNYPISLDNVIEDIYNKITT